MRKITFAVYNPPKEGLPYLAAIMHLMARSLLWAIAGAIHHDLCGHRILRCKVPEFYARFRLTRNPTTERSR
jgi:hypothetical protein